MKHAVLVVAVGMAACVADPSVEILPTTEREPQIILIHGTGELGADIAARWSLPVTVEAPDSLDEIETLIDPTRRAILMGQGSGASLAYSIACARPDLVAAIVMLSGVAGEMECANGSRVSALTIHGTVDSHTPYSTAQATFERVQQLADCTTVRYVDEPALNATVESLGCLERIEGQTRRAEHWRVIGWDHNPDLGPEFGETVLTWALPHR